MVSHKNRLKKLHIGFMTFILYLILLRSLLYNQNWSNLKWRRKVFIYHAFVFIKTFRNFLIHTKKGRDNYLLAMKITKIRTCPWSKFGAIFQNYAIKNGFISKFLFLIFKLKGIIFASYLIPFIASSFLKLDWKECWAWVR